MLLGPDGRARLTDFGIAHLTDGTKLTSTGFVVGTENYLAPEVRRGGPATVASDLYSLGVVLRECAPAGVPPELTELIDRLTDPDPARRPPSAEAARALLTATAPLPVAGPSGAVAAASTAPTDAPTEAAPAPTLVAPAAARDARAARRPRKSPSMTSTDTRRSWAGRGLGVALAVVLAVAVLALVLLDRGGDGEPLQVPPPGGSLSKQLDQLDNSVDHARR